jgi:hypothetical protein
MRPSNQTKRWPFDGLAGGRRLGVRLACILASTAFFLFGTSGSATAALTCSGNANYGYAYAYSSSASYTGVERYISTPAGNPATMLGSYANQHLLYWMEISQGNSSCPTGVCWAQNGMAIGNLDNNPDTMNWTAYFETSSPIFGSVVLLAWNDATIAKNGFYNVFYNGLYSSGYPAFEAYSNGVYQGAAPQPTTTGNIQTDLEAENIINSASCPAPGAEYFGTNGTASWSTSTELYGATGSAPNNWAPWNDANANGYGMGSGHYHIYFLNASPPYSHQAFETIYS